MYYILNLEEHAHSRSSSVCFNQAKSLLTVDIPTLKCSDSNKIGSQALEGDAKRPLDGGVKAPAKIPETEAAQPSKPEQPVQHAELLLAASELNFSLDRHFRQMQRGLWRAVLRPQQLNKLRLKLHSPAILSSSFNTLCCF